MQDILFEVLHGIPQAIQESSALQHYNISLTIPSVLWLWNTISHKNVDNL
jgi:hypothetical protein